MHTTCSKGVYTDNNHQHSFAKKGPTYKERMQTQKECLEFCYNYGASLNDLSAPFPNPRPATAGGEGGGAGGPTKYQGHIPLGMSLINGHLPSAIYLLSIGASGRTDEDAEKQAAKESKESSESKESKEHPKNPTKCVDPHLEPGAQMLIDEEKWMKCLAHERTETEEKELHEAYTASMLPANFNMNHLQAGINQLRLLGQRYSSRNSPFGTFSCPQGVIPKIFEFARNIVDSHQEYHTFLLCTRRAFATGNKQHVLEPLGRIAFLHVRQMVKGCLIVPDVSKDNLQRCYRICLRITQRFGFRCGACGSKIDKHKLKCCSVVYCGKKCQVRDFTKHRKICDRRKSKKGKEKQGKEKI